MATRYAEGSSHPITNTFRCLTVKVCSVVEALGNVEARGKLCYGVSRLARLFQPAWFAYFNKLPEGLLATQR